MNILIVYAHPEPTSFTAALKERAVHSLTKKGHTVEVSDLYKDNFNPVAGRHDFVSTADPTRFHYQSEQELAIETDGFSEDIKREQRKVAKADLILFVFPLWWGGVPAIVKGWVDRVLAYGFAYLDGYRFEKGLFKGKRGCLCITTGGTKKRFSKRSDGGTYGEMGDVLYPMTHCVLDYLGLEQMDPFIAYAAPRVDDNQRKQYLDEWEEKLNAMVEDPEWQKRLQDLDKLDVKKMDKPKNGWSRSN